MNAIAKAKYVRMSPRKVRQVVDLVRNKGVDEAINLLHFSTKRAARPVEKTIRSAVANILSQQQASAKIDTEELFIKEARVEAGPTLKRFRPGSMGRPMRIRKRTCHITVVVAGKNSGE